MCKLFWLYYMLVFFIYSPHYTHYICKKLFRTNLCKLDSSLYYCYYYYFWHNLLWMRVGQNRVDLHDLMINYLYLMKFSSPADSPQANQYPYDYSFISRSYINESSFILLVEILLGWFTALFSYASEQIIVLQNQNSLLMTTAAEKSICLGGCCWNLGSSLTGWGSTLVLTLKSSNVGPVFFDLPEGLEERVIDFTFPRYSGRFYKNLSIE
jgi:hypothetical protein